VKHIVFGTIALMFVCRIAQGQMSVEDKWGSLLDDVANLTWAEKHCSGRAANAVRELRLYFRKHAGPEFEEAIIRVETDHRDSIDDAKPHLTERETIQALCRGMAPVWGERGSAPGWWIVNRPPAAVTPWRGGNESLRRYGQFAWALSLIQQMRARCIGFPSALAEEFTRLFIAAGGEKTFKERAKVEANMLPWKEAELCEAVDNTYGRNAKDWPILWYATPRQVDAPPPAPPEEKVPPTIVRPPATAFRHGFVRSASGGERVAPFAIKTAPGQSYLVKLVRTADKQEQIIAFIIGGQPFSIKVPIGTYELRYAAGQQWVGEEDFFGPDTVFFKADRLLVFSIEGHRVLGTEVELILQRGGNFHTSTIRREAF
jgi:hypothetical protein